MIKIVLADDHLLVRNGIQTLLEQESEIKVVGQGANGEEALTLVAQHRPDLLIVDIRMPVKDGIQTVKELRTLFPKTRVIVLSMHDTEAYILEAINVGAHGYLLKGAGKEEFIKAIHTVCQGGKYFSGDISEVLVANIGKQRFDVRLATEHTHGLTKKEIKILSLILSGMTNTEIAEELNNSKRTIETHRFNLMKKLNVKNIMELVAKAKEIGFKDA